MASNGINPEECQFLHVRQQSGLTIYNMMFRSIGEVQLFLQDDPDRNREIFGLMHSENADEEFAGPPLEKAIAYCLGGYKEQYDQFLKFSRQLEAVNHCYVRDTRVEKSFVGQRPNVPAYIAGAPKTMYRSKMMEEKKVINIYMNVVYTFAETDEQIRARGIITLNLIKILEQNNYLVNFRLFEISTVQSEVFICEVSMKRPGEELNPKLCYYPMCGKGFVRRIMARIKESMPFSEYWGFSYGTVPSQKQIFHLMNIKENDIYIGTPTEMNIKGKNIYADADAFLDTLGIGDRINIPHYSKENELV